MRVVTGLYDVQVVTTTGEPREWAEEFEQKHQDGFWDRMENEWQEMAR